MNGLFAPRLSLLLTLAHQMKSVPWEDARIKSTFRQYLANKFTL